MDFANRLARSLHTIPSLKFPFTTVFSPTATRQMRLMNGTIFFPAYHPWMSSSHYSARVRQRTVLGVLGSGIQNTQEIELGFGSILRVILSAQPLYSCIINCAIVCYVKALVKVNWIIDVSAHCAFSCAFLTFLPLFSPPNRKNDADRTRRWGVGRPEDLLAMDVDWLLDSNPTSAHSQ